MNGPEDATMDFALPSAVKFMSPLIDICQWRLTLLLRGMRPILPPVVSDIQAELERQINALLLQ